MTSPGNANISSLGNSSSTTCLNLYSPLQPNQSTFFDAPSAHECSKLQLFPACTAAAVHAWHAQPPLLPRSGSFAPPAPASISASSPAATAVANLSLQQQLYSKAAGAVAGLAGSSNATNSSSRGRSMAWQPRHLLQQVSLLYVWRLWFMGDLFLAFKLGICLSCLAVAALYPGEMSPCYLYAKLQFAGHASSLQLRHAACRNDA
jgi:hypothetical protein